MGASYSNTRSDISTNLTAYGSAYQTNGIQNAAYPTCTSARGAGCGNAQAPTALLYNYNTSAITVGGKYDFSNKIIGFINYNRFVLSNPSQNMLAGANGNISEINGLTVAAAYNYKGTNQVNQLVWAGTSYNVSAQDTVKLGYYLLNQGAFGMTKPGKDTVTNYGAGMQAWYSLMVTHEFSKRTMVYGGYMFNSNHGNQTGGNPMAQVGTSQSAYYSANSVFATGIKHVF